MEKFRKTINFRITLLWIFVLVVTLITISQRFFDFGFTVPEIEWSYGLGLMSGTVAVAVYYLFTYIRALQNEIKLQALFIEETDERNVMIRAKTGGAAINIIMATLICATLIGRIFNEIVFYTLFATLMFVAIVMVLLKIYYKKKL